MALGARRVAGGDSSAQQRSRVAPSWSSPRSCPRDSGPPSVPAGPLEGAWVPESELGAGGDSAPLWGLRLPKWQPLGQAKTLPAHLESVWQLLSPGALPMGRRGLAVAARRPSGMLISVLTGGSFLGNLSQSFGRNGAVLCPFLVVVVKKFQGTNTYTIFKPLNHLRGRNCSPVLRFSLFW